MILIKYILIAIVFSLSTYIGLIYSKSYEKRVKDLEEMKKALSIFKSKIKYTYATIPDVFLEISREINSNIADIFKTASDLMNKYVAAEAWKMAIEEKKVNVSFNKNDIENIMSLSKMLGNTDLEGQINMIDLTINLVDKQIEDARNQERKNSKLYKTLGISAGLTISIILI